MEPHILEACEPFLLAIVEKPGDALPRLIFADWLEDHDCIPEATGQRWAASNGKYPHPHENEKWWSGGWYSFEEPTGFPAYLPEKAFAYERGKHPGGKSIWQAPDLFECEKRFLIRCGEIGWENGEPIRRTSNASRNHGTSRDSGANHLAAVQDDESFRQRAGQAVESDAG